MLAGENTVWNVCFVNILSPDIPEDEAQYWTGKLERINMGIHDEVRHILLTNNCLLTFF